MRGSSELSRSPVATPWLSSLPFPVMPHMGWFKGSSVAHLLVQLTCFSGNVQNTLYLMKVYFKQNESLLSANSDRPWRALDEQGLSETLQRSHGAGYVSFFLLSPPPENNYLVRVTPVISGLISGFKCLIPKLKSLHHTSCLSFVRFFENLPITCEECRARTVRDLQTEFLERLRGSE